MESTNTEFAVFGLVYEDLNAPPIDEVLQARVQALSDMEVVFGSAAPAELPAAESEPEPRTLEQRLARVAEAMHRKREPWMLLAECRGVDPELFFPERGDSTKAQRAVCAQCDVQVECLDYALKHSEKRGIWGGTSEKERRRIRRNQNQTD